MEAFVDKDGRRRVGIRVVCGGCGEDFLTRCDQPAKCCSKECSYIRQQKRVKIICACCQKEFEKRTCSLKGSKSSLYFCSRKCKDESQKIGGITAVMPSHYGNSNGKHLWKRLIEENPICVDCGVRARFLLTIHHIDGDRKRNVASNLEVVCVTCHALKHLKLVDGEWRYDPYCLTPREAIYGIRKDWGLGVMGT